MFSDDDMIIAAITDPHFKMSWLTDPIKIVAAQKFLEQLCAQEQREKIVQESQQCNFYK